MKCPYRTHIYIFRNSNGDETGRAVEFEQCYGNECPLYVPESKLSGGELTVSATCARADMEWHGKVVKT